MASLDELIDERPPIDLASAALWYAERGWHVFPVSDDGKVPATAHGYLDAGTNPDQIRTWWSNNPASRIGLALRASGLIAIDVDVGTGKTGDVTFAALEQKLGALPRSNVQRSGRGGMHVIMRDPSPGADGWTRPQHDGGGCRGNMDGIGCGRHVDVKCNGHIVLAPSGAYEWIALDTARLDPVPAMWADAIRKPAPESDGETPTIDEWEHDSDGELTTDDAKALDAKLSTMSRVSGSGQTFAAIVTIFHDYGASTDHGWPWLLRWNEEYSGEPHSEDELARQVERVAGIEHRGGRGFARKSISPFARIARAPLPPDFAINALQGVPLDIDELCCESATPISSPDDAAPATVVPVATRGYKLHSIADVACREVPALRTYSTGMRDLDARIGGGLSTRALHVPISRTGAGKTGFALGMLIHNAREGVPALYVSTELDSNEAMLRVAAQRLGVAHNDLLSGRIPRERARDAVRDLPIYLVGQEDMGRGEVGLKVVDDTLDAIVARHGVPPITCVDYLQMLADEDPRSVRMGISAVANTLRAMSQHHDCVIIGVSSAARTFYRVPKDGADDPLSYLGAAKESGDIEFAAANILYLDVGESDETGTHDARVVVAKARRGTAGFVGARFHGPSGRWSQHSEAVAKLSSAQRKERASKIASVGDDEKVLAEIKADAARGIWRTARGWRDLSGCHDGMGVPDKRVRDSLLRLERAGKVELTTIHPKTSATCRGHGYVALPRPKVERDPNAPPSVFSGFVRGQS